MNWYSDFRVEWKQIIETVAAETDIVYRDIEISKTQIQNGQVKDARSSLSELRKKYKI